ncbi:MAG: S-layer homology domain-containing protein [Bifidobacteriaceae bacterium]|jgi:hypothetical protein|nr:S-layer homology domain-containing protein [Bifidobacteriaceae bacterium]
MKVRQRIRNNISILVVTTLGIAAVIFLAILLYQTTLDFENEGAKISQPPENFSTSEKMNQPKTLKSLEDLSEKDLSQSTKKRLSEQGIGSLEKGTKSIIVDLKGVDESLKESDFAQYKKQIWQKQQQLISQISSNSVHAVVSKRFQSIPAMSFLVDKTALDFLKNSSQVESVQDNKISFKTADTTPVNPNPINSMGGSASIGFTLDGKQYNGDNYAVAVLDTGVDAAHSKLAGKVITEACFSYVVQSEGISSLCPGSTKINDGLDFKTGAGTAAPCADGCDHGTHVASEAALSYQDVTHDYNVYQSGTYNGDIFTNSIESLTVNGQGISGGARNAKIVGIQVFSRFAQGAETGIFSLTESWLAALDWIYTNANDRTLFPEPIAAVNLSLGSSGYTTAGCSSITPVVKNTFSSLISRNIAVFAAAGNDWGTVKNKVDYPACVIGAQGIAAAQNNGVAYSSYSQNGDATDLVAVGGDIVFQQNLDGAFWCDETKKTTCSIDENSIIWGPYALKSGKYAWTLAQGTSMASPYAAGIYTSLKSYAQNASVDDITNIMKITGSQLKDTRAGATTSPKPFIQGDAALQVLSNKGVKPVIHSFKPSKSNPFSNETIVLSGQVTPGSKCAINNKVGAVGVKSDGTFSAETLALSNTFVLTCVNSQNNAYISSILNVSDYVPVKSVAFSKDLINLKLGETQSLDFSLEPDNATNSSVKFTSSNESVVKISENPLSVQALSVGASTIKAVSWDNSSLFSEIIVNVQDAQPLNYVITDVASDDQARPDIEQMYINKFTTGCSFEIQGNDYITKYCPSDSVKREQMAAFLYYLKGYPDYTPPAVSPFSDLKTDNQFYKQIMWGVANGVWSGYEDKTFRGNKAITRGQFVSVLWRFYGSPVPILPSKSPFSDIKSTDAIYKAIIWAKNKLITTGYEDKTFKPYRTCSRAQMAMFIIRAWKADLS